MSYSYSSVFSYFLQSSFKPSSKGKDNRTKKKEETKKKEINYENELFKQNDESIYEDETLFQYISPANVCYYIGLENKGKSALRMKLTLEGLYNPDDPNNDEINFRIDARSKIAFYVKIDESTDEDLSFFLDFV